MYTDFITTTQLAATVGVSRLEMTNRLSLIGLLTPDHRPSRKAVARNISRSLGSGKMTLTLWHHHKTTAALRAAGHEEAGLPDAHKAPSVTMLCNDVLHELRQLADSVVHGGLADFPYGLEPIRTNRRTARGFLGQEWDALPTVEVCQEMWPTKTD